MPPTRVLQVNKLYPPHVGGIEEVVRRLAEGLASRDAFESKALVCSEGLRGVTEETNGVGITRTGSLGSLLSEPIAPAFLSRLRRAEADIFQFHNPFPMGELGGLLLPREARLVAWYHSDVFRQKLLLHAYRPMLEAFLARCRVVIASSPNLIRSSPLLQPLAGQCRVVNYGLDTRRFALDEETSRAAGAIRDRYAGNRGLVLFVGRLVYYKGVEHLIEAMKGIDAGLLILGRGPLREGLERQAASARISGRVHFVDWAGDEEMPAYFHACDMLVLPSVARTEAFGLVILEAQACGKPVISTELGTGTSYANLDGVTGAVVPAADTRALAEEIDRLFKNPSLREELGLRGKERVEREFGISNMIDSVAGIYEEVMGDRR